MTATTLYVDKETKQQLEKFRRQLQSKDPLGELPSTARAIRLAVRWAVASYPHNATKRGGK